MSHTGTGLAGGCDQFGLVFFGPSRGAGVSRALTGYIGSSGRAALIPLDVLACAGDHVTLSSSQMYY